MQLITFETILGYPPTMMAVTTTMQWPPVTRWFEDATVQEVQQQTDWKRSHIPPDPEGKHLIQKQNCLPVYLQNQSKRTSRNNIKFDLIFTSVGVQPESDSHTLHAPMHVDL